MSGRSMKFVRWTGMGVVRDRYTGPKVFYVRMANAGRLQLGPVCVMWPMPWAKECHGKVGYGRGRSRWSGILDALFPNGDQK